MIEFLGIVCIIAGAGLTGFALAAIANHRRLKKLNVAVSDLEQQVAVVNEQMADDPQRAGIDMGKRYAINQVQTTLDRLRREVPR